MRISFESRTFDQYNLCKKMVIASIVKHMDVKVKKILGTRKTADSCEKDIIVTLKVILTMDF